MKNIVVFGSSGALGSPICDELESLDYKLIKLDINDEADKIVDATNEDEVAVFFDQLLEEKFRLHGLVNLVGKIHSHAFYNVMSKHKYIETHEWIDQFNINLNSAFFIAKHYHKYCTKLRIKCNLVNFSSICASGNPGQIAYSSSKAALETMTQTLAKELGPFDHKFNVISPGFIDVKSTKASMRSEKLSDIEDNTPLRRLGDVRSLANGIHFLLTSEFVTGHILKIDGGFRI